MIKVSVEKDSKTPIREAQSQRLEYMHDTTHDPKSYQTIYFQKTEDSEFISGSTLTSIHDREMIPGNILSKDKGS